MSRPSTVGDLRASGWKSRTVREELRSNLVEKLRAGEDVFTGIRGYEGSVVPDVERAILAGHDIVFLGERGQAKSRMMRQLVGLLDEYLPALADGELNDDPYAPNSLAGRAAVAEMGDDAAVKWIHRSDRYSEKLATPDISVADLIGEVDPIKVAEGRYLADESTIHFGLIPRSNRGIIAINELPDLAERIQVGLLNLLEERDIQIRGYKFRLDLDLMVVASANPEDYTNRGRIITPLKDRFGATIRTHYPLDADAEAEIVDSEAEPPAAGVAVQLPDWMREILAEITHEARRSPSISQRSGVSVRASISNRETAIAASVRRALRNRETLAVPRPADLEACAASTMGKIEVEALEADSALEVFEDLCRRSLLGVFRTYTAGHDLRPFVEKFDDGLTVEFSAESSAAEVCAQFGELRGLAPVLEALGAGDSPETTAAALELLLEGLHLSRRINRTPIGDGVRYSV